MCKTFFYNPCIVLYRQIIVSYKCILDVSSGRDFVEEKLGSKYVMNRSVDFAISFEESGAATPMFFILSPGVDPLKDVEKHGTVA